MEREFATALDVVKTASMRQYANSGVEFDANKRISHIQSKKNVSALMVDFIDMPVHLRERVTCSIRAAQRYGVPANILLAVAEQEGGRPGQWVRNSNGTYDVGALQFNTAYLAGLAQYGIRAEHVAQPGCYAYNLAAWRLRDHLKNDSGDIWTRVANYHSKTPVHNARYRAQLLPRAKRWADWLNARVPVCTVTWGGGASPARSSACVN